MRVVMAVIGVSLCSGVLLRHATAQQPASEPPKAVSAGVRRYTYFPGKQCVLRLDDDVILQTLKWTGDTPNPPVSARTAIKKSGATKKALLKDDRDWFWGLASVALTPCNPGNPGNEETRGHWYWLVTYEAFPTGGMTGPPPQLEVAILMDGTVVKPEIRDYEPVGFGGESAPNQDPGNLDADK